MSNFSFSPSVFKRFASQKRQKVSLCGNGLKWALDSIMLKMSQDLILSLDIVEIQPITGEIQESHQ